MANLQEALPAVHGMGKKQEAAFVEKYLTLADVSVFDIDALILEYL